MTMSQYNNTTIWQYNMTEQYDNTKKSQYSNTTIWQYNMRCHINTTTWQYHNTTTWQYNTSEQYDNMTTSQYNSTTIWQFNMTEQYDNKPISQYMSQYVRAFICIETFMIRLENIQKVVRIDNIRSASDHEMNNICKLVIECETLVVFAWWTQKEFRQMSTTCNYLEDGIWIADDISVLESSISMAVTISIMYVASSGLGKNSIIWRPLISCCVSLRMLSSLNRFKRTGIPVLLIPHLPPSSSPCLGCGIIMLLQLFISWHCIIIVYLVRNAFVIFDTAESTFVVCGWSTAPFVAVILVAHCIGS